MNDIIDNFVKNSKQNSSSRPPSTQSTQSASSGADLEAGVKKSRSWDSLKHTFQFVPAGKDEIPLFARALPTDRDFTKAAIAFGLSAIFFALSTVFLPYIAFTPHKFALFFSIAVTLLLISFGYLNGPQRYAAKLWMPKNRLFSVMLVGSLLLSLVASLVVGSYLLTLTCCLVEVRFV